MAVYGKGMEKHKKHENAKNHGMKYENNGKSMGNFCVLTPLF